MANVNNFSAEHKFPIVIFFFDPKRSMNTYSRHSTMLTNSSGLIALHLLFLPFQKYRTQ